MMFCHGKRKVTKTLGHGMVSQTFRVVISTRNLLKHTQRFISMEILYPIKLIMKFNYYSPKIHFNLVVGISPTHSGL